MQTHCHIPLVSQSRYSLMYEKILLFQSVVLVADVGDQDPAT